jgi:hypothetical protein
MSQHIVGEGTQDIGLANELKDLERRFKVVQKRIKPKHRVQSKSVKLRELEEHYELECKSGRLVCPVNKDLLLNYDHDKDKYKEVAAPKSMVQTYREVSNSPSYDKYLSRAQSPNVSVKEVLGRLYQTPSETRPASRRAASIELKYKGLFEHSKLSSWEKAQLQWAWVRPSECKFK